MDGDEVFFGDSSTGTIARVPKAGGESTVLASGDPGVASVAVDAWCVYWTNTGAGTGAHDGTVMKAPR